MTMPELPTTTTESYTPAPETQDLKWVFDISGWLDEHIVKLKNHIYLHLFKFFHGGDGKARMAYKNWVQDKAWKPDDVPIILLPNLPVGTPSLIRPSSSHRMDDDQLQWWENFITQEEEGRKQWSQMEEREVENLSSQDWFMNRLQKYNAKREAKPEEPEGPQRYDKELERLPAKENYFPPVSITVLQTKPPNKRHPVSHSWEALFGSA